jgi:hypothetical protein
MRFSIRLLAVLTLFGALSAASVANRKKQAPSPKILSAKTVYFRDQTGSDAVRNGALDELRKWGRFQIVSEREHADLVFVLTSDPYRGGLILLAGGQTASVDVEGHVEEDAIPFSVRIFDCGRYGNWRKDLERRTCVGRSTDRIQQCWRSPNQGSRKTNQEIDHVLEGRTCSDSEYIATSS